MDNKSAALPSSVINWLQTNINNIYKTQNKRILFNDILWCLTQFKSILRPRTRVFVESNGNSKLLLCLYGTFSSSSSSSSINNSLDFIENTNSTTVNNQLISQNKITQIPILIWILNKYPRSIPLIYIDLDKLNELNELDSNFEIKINLSKNIDSNGQIYLPIFNNWDHNDPNCNIINIVKDLQFLINNKVILYKLSIQTKNDDQRQFDRQIHSNQSTNDTNSILPPPIPDRIIPDSLLNSVSSMSLNSIEDNNTTTTSLQQTGTVLPSPNLPNGNNTPLPSTNNSSNNLNNSNSKIKLPPPIPQRPVLPSRSQSTSHHSTPLPSIIPNSNEISKSKKDTNNSKIVQTDIIDLMNDDSLVHSINTSQHEAIDKLISHLQALNNMTQHKIQKTKTLDLMNINNCIIQFEQLFAHEKRQIDELNSNIDSQIESIDTEIGKLNKLENDWSSNFKKIEDISLDTQENIQIIETLGLNQCYQLVAKDKAITDTLSLLNDSLNEQKISLDSFVRKSRQLAREQFAAKFHLEKNFNLLDNN